jgi:two-component sensor histidine kinase/ligand-binding sensor domain-containing protein
VKKLFISWALILIVTIDYGQTTSLKKIGDFKWVRNANNKAAKRLPVKANVCDLVVTTIKKTESKSIVSKKIAPESKIIKFGSTELKQLPIKFIAHKIRYSKKLKSSKFIFKDNSKSNIQYTDKAHGLIAAGVTSIAEDDNHIIWMATTDGLVKFDGVNYHLYDQNSGLPSVRFSSMLFVSGWGLWVNTTDGFYYIKDDKCYVPVSKHFDVKQFNGKAISKDLKGNVWLTSINQGAFCFYKNNTFSILNSSNGIPSNNIWDIKFDKNNIWLAQWDKGAVLITPTKIVQFLKTGKDLLSNKIVSIYNVGDTTWMGGFKTGLIRFTPKDTVVLSPSGKFDERIYYFEKSPKGIWFTIHGFGLVEFNANKITTYTEENGLSGTFTYFVFKDSNQNIWVTDLRSGLSRINENILQKRESSIFTFINSIRYRAQSKDKYWFQSGNKLIKETDSTYEIYNIVATKNVPQLNHVLDGFINEDGSIWGATYGSGGVAYITKKHVTFYSYSSLFQDEITYSVHRDKEKRIWFSTLQFGLIYFDPNDQQFYQRNYNNGALGDFTFQSQTDRDGSVWCSFNGGFQKIENNVFYDFYVNDSLYNIAVNTFYISKSGTQYIGTNGNGLLILKGNKVYALDKSCGLISNYIESVIELNGKLWITTDDGIDRVMVNKKRVYFDRVFDASYGLQLKSMRGILFLNDQNIPSWATLDGVLDYYPEFEHKLKDPILKITSIEVDQKHQSLNRTFEAYSKDKIKLRYYLINWGHENEYQHKCILVSENNKDTINLAVGEEGVLDISNLNPNDYKLFIVAKHAHKNYYSKGIRFSIIPYWYNSMGFRLLIILLVCCYFWYLYKKKKNENSRLTRKVEEQTIVLVNEKLELEKSNETIWRQNKEKDSLIQEVHHRVKNNLQFIAAMFKMQINSTEDKSNKAVLYEAYRRVNAMTLVHEMLYNKDDMEFVAVKEYIHELLAKLTEANSDQVIPVKINVNVDDLKIDVNHCMAIGMITSEIINNAFKYAFKSNVDPKIDVSLIYDSATFMITYSIKDNGEGLNENYKSNGLGMRLIDIFSRQIEVDFVMKNENGLMYTFLIPYEKHGE